MEEVERNIQKLKTGAILYPLFVIFLIDALMSVLFSAVIKIPIWAEAIINGLVVAITLYEILRRINLKPTSTHADDLKKFKLAVDNAAEQVVITDKEGVVIYINQATETITGYTVKEATGKKAGFLWRTPMPKEFYENLWKTIKTDKKTFTGEIKNRRKNGELYDAEIRISPVLDDNQDILFFVGIERDISREKQVDRAKTEFLSLASHQLRTPPTIINWYAEILESGDLGRINKKQAEYLMEISKANKRMIDLINSLLNISRIELNTFMVSVSKVDIKKLIDEAVEEQTKQFNSKIEIKKSYYPTTCTINADTNLMHIIVDNLISNAIKYSPRTNGKIEIGIKKESDALFISVKDNGIGISKENQNRIFEKMFRSEKAISIDPNGNGLGLYMVKKIVDTVGGKIWFESKENRGTIFYLSLPASGMKQKTGTTKLVRTQHSKTHNN